MRIGIGLPNTVPGVTADLAIRWARHAEKRGFAMVSTVGRIAWPGPDSLTLLAVAGGATERIGLQSNVILGPTRAKAILARIAVTLAQALPGRFTMGLGLGDRPSDYRAAERDFHRRGAAFDETLELLSRAARAEPVVHGDEPGEERPLAAVPVELPLLVGGRGSRAIERVAKWAAGWTSGAQPLEKSRAMIARVRNAWHAAGRNGNPRLVGMAYFCADPSRADDGRQYLRDYYASYGTRSEEISARMLRDSEQLKTTLRQHEEIGMTEFIFTPTLLDLAEVDRLADVVL
jgi:alkanesulfonate monooxygenase SsuD/methylene tetrahydromethanopterin reductase-like flavin-dependent oxidoreductase (luciferase family)